MGSCYPGLLIGNYSVRSIEYYNTWIYAVVKLRKGKPDISARGGAVLAPPI